MTGADPALGKGEVSMHTPCNHDVPPTRQPVYTVIQEKWAVQTLRGGVGPFLVLSTIRGPF